MSEAERKQINDPINEPIIGSVMNFFASPVMTMTKLSRNFAPVRTAFMKFTAVENFYKDRAAAAHKPLHDLSDASKQKVMLGLDKARRTRQEVNEADYTAEEMSAIRAIRTHMRFIYDAAIDGVARKYFDPALAKNDADRARLGALIDEETTRALQVASGHHAALAAALILPASLASPAAAQQPAPIAAEAPLPAFPGALGWAARTPGGPSSHPPWT
jgi:hypothetical protein